MRALWIGATGLTAAQTKIDTHAHNVANINTVGFKGKDVLFSEAMHRQVHRPNRPASQIPGAQEPPAIGGGTLPVGTRTDFRPGAWLTTGEDWHLAIQGDGFFIVGLDGAPDGQAYTRAGDFRLDRNGRVVDPWGNPLLGSNGRPLTVPRDAVQVTVQRDGQIMAQMEDGDSRSLGRLRLARFINPEGLASLGNGLFAATEASGEPQWVNPGGNQLWVQQGALENANVDLANEMVGLISAQRTMQFAARVVQTTDEMMGIANRIYR